MRNPPRLGTYVLDLLTERNAPLAGDLVEQFQEGRSTNWYWRQVLVAIAESTWTALCNHKGVVLRAIVSGELTFIALNELISRQPWRPHLHVQSPLWWAYIVSTTLLMFGASGWVAARFHRRHQAAVLVLYTTFTGVVSLVLMLPMLRLHLVNSIDSPRFRPYLALDIAIVLLSVVGVLAGGLLDRLQSLKSRPRNKTA